MHSLSALAGFALALLGGLAPAAAQITKAPALASQRPVDNAQRSPGCTLAALAWGLGSAFVVLPRP